jgi:hypothetical protein
MTTNGFFLPDISTPLMCRVETSLTKKVQSAALSWFITCLARQTNKDKEKAPVQVC